VDILARLEGGSVSSMHGETKGERLMRIFELRRDVDETGISGTGTVARGIILPDGKCVLYWLTEHTSITIYDSVDEVVAIHGHAGKTRVIEVADLDFVKLSSLVMNWYQDQYEGVENDFVKERGKNYPYMWNQREDFAKMFVFRPLDEVRDESSG
jgi:hypothetical protein